MVATATQIAELAGQREAAITTARQIFQRAKAENRLMTGEETQQFHSLHDQADKLKTQIDGNASAEDRQNSAEAYSRQPRGRRPGLVRSGGESSKRGRADRSGVLRFNCGYDKLRRKKKYIRVHPGTDAHSRCQPEYRSDFETYLTSPNAAGLQLDKGSKGGFLGGEDFVAEIIKEADDECQVRKYARTFVTDQASLGAPKRDTRVSSAAWSSELSEPTNDSAAKIGKRVFMPHYLSGAVICSRELLASKLIDVLAYLRGEIIYDKDTVEEQAFLTGNGVNRPLGFMVNSTQGVSTARNYTTDTTTTALTWKTIVGAVYHLKAAYRRSPNTVWWFHRNAIRHVSNLVDSTGQPLWEVSKLAGQPDMLKGYPVVESEFAPGTFTAGSIVGALACMDRYWIADSTEFEIQRLVETRARKNQDEFLYRHKTDGMPVDELGFVLLQLAAA